MNDLLKAWKELLNAINDNTEYMEDSKTNQIESFINVQYISEEMDYLTYLINKSYA